MSVERDAEAERVAAAARFRQRLLGASVLIAIAVIVLPLLLDGSGSESQFRRVEKLRDEPPRIIDRPTGAVADDVVAHDKAAYDKDANDRAADQNSALGTDAVTEADPASDSASVTTPDSAAVAATETAPARIRVGEDDPPDYLGDSAEGGVVAGAGEVSDGLSSDGLSAWVVQAGSFREQDNAVAVRDVLRRAGFATFVTDRDGIYRVQVGPLVDQAHAEEKRDEVVALLGRDAIVVPYP